MEGSGIHENSISVFVNSSIFSRIGPVGVVDVCKMFSQLIFALASSTSAGAAVVLAVEFVPPFEEFDSFALLPPPHAVSTNPLHNIKAAIFL
ncbi:hypothetical protein D3C75_1103570 [compost metagenome]